MGIERADLAVIGGGIVGLATAFRLLERRPDLSVVVVEREAELASHQTGHNSGVLHSGIYYAPGSLKARLCGEGKAALEAFAMKHNIPFDRCGKLVVALDSSELPRLDALHQRALANGVAGVEVVGPDRMRELEPHVVGIRAVWSPFTGIIDFRRVALTIAEEFRRLGGIVETGRGVSRIQEDSHGLILGTNLGDLVVRDIVVCAGLWADRVAAMTRDGGRERIVPFRGDYYRLTQPARHLVRGLIYPVPDARFPFLGVHFTRRIDGEVWAGPNAVLAFARDGYRRRDANIRDLAATLTSSGFLRLATRYWRTGLAEMWRDVSKRAYVAQLRRYIPDLRGEQLTFGPSGVRAQALDPDGSLVDDFRVGGSRHILHVRNAPSPAATASLAIGREVAEAAIDRFKLR